MATDTGAGRLPVPSVKTVKVPNAQEMSRLLRTALLGDL